MVQLEKVAEMGGTDSMKIAALESQIGQLKIQVIDKEEYLNAVNKNLILMENECSITKKALEETRN
jgi:hypothetical protein